MLDIDNLPIGCVIIRRWDDGEIWVLKFLGKSHGFYFKCYVLRRLDGDSAFDQLHSIHKSGWSETTESASVKDYTKYTFKDELYLSWERIIEFLT